MVSSSGSSSSSSSRRSSRLQPITADEVAVARTAIAKFARNRHFCHQLQRAYYSNAFPVLVQDHITRKWVKGIFQRLEESGQIVVATGASEDLRCNTYETAHIVFENGRMVVVTDELRNWTAQEGDPMDALAAAPLGFVGTVKISTKERRRQRREMRKTPRRRGSKANSDILSINHELVNMIAAGDVEMDVQDKETLVGNHPDFVPKTTLDFLPTTNFTFLLDLTEPVGLEVFGARRRRRRVVVVSAVEAGSQGVMAGIKARCIVTRVGDDCVRTPEEFEVAIVKRRIVSAMIRSDALEKDPTADVTALSHEDEALLRNEEVKKLITPSEFTKMREEFQELDHGAFCTFTFMDQNFDIFRHAPSEFHAFHRVAKLVPPEPFWGTFDFILSRYKGGARFYEILQMMRKAIAVVISVFLSKHSIEVQAMAMLLMVLISFILHIRLRPYDDQNSSVRMNSLY